MQKFSVRALAALLALALHAVAAERPFPTALALDNAINSAVERELIPGAVVLIGHR